MIFIAKDADFSANNLGKVSVKTVDDLSADTLSLLSLYGKSWSDDQKIAIDDFVEGLKIKTWKSKIKHIFIPIMCPPNDNLTSREIINNDTNVGYDLIDKEKKSFNCIAYGGTYGFMKIGVNGFLKDFEHSTSGFHSNFSPRFVFDENVKDDSITGFYYFVNSGNSFAVTGPTEWNTFNVINNYIEIYHRSRSNLGLWTLDDEKNGLCIGINCSATENLAEYYVKGDIVNGVYSTEAPVGAADRILLQANWSVENSICFCSIGTSMTTEEFKEYGDMIKVLMDTLKRI